MFPKFVVLHITQMGLTCVDTKETVIILVDEFHRF